MAVRQTLEDLARRPAIPEPWAEGEKIPWDDPEFSARMLEEHLSQEHGLASRRLPEIEAAADWLAAGLAEGRAGRVLDLGCGPGLYTSALSRRGLSCVGIDFAPAAIAHARSEAEAAGLDCRYIEADVRTADLEELAADGGAFDLVTMIYGEFNVFRREEALELLRRARAALASGGGQLVVEGHTFAAVERIGAGGRRPSWQLRDRGLFSDQPYLELYESFWETERAVATERYDIIDLATAEVTSHAASTQAYDDAAYEALVAEAGLAITDRYASLRGDAYEANPDADLLVMVAEAA